MIYPALHAGVEFRKVDPTRAPGIEARREPAGALYHLARLHASVGRVDDKAQSRDAGRHRHHLGGVLMHRQAQLSQTIDDRPLPFP